MLLSITDLRFGYGEQLLFDGADLSLNDGERVGLVGRNGIGKSTLFGLITGALAPETGSVAIHPRARVGEVAQEAPTGEASLIATVLAANLELTQLQTALAQEQDPNALAEIHARLIDIGAASAPARAAAILSGLGFDQAAIEGPVGALSGGWRMRVALAGVLFAQPDLLLLDEPSNYLDFEGVIWLKNYLRHYPRSLILISHDRDVLNAVATGIIHLSGGKLTSYRGNYDRFERTRAENQARQSKEQVRVQARRAHLQSFVDRFRAKANKASQAQSRLKMLERLADNPPPPPEHAVALDFPSPEHLAPPLIHLDAVAAGYCAGQPVLQNLNLRLDPDDRVALLGVNGAGKSTFAKLLAGELKPQAGTINRAKKLSVGHFAQHQLDALRPGETAFQHMAAAMPHANPTQVRAALGRFAITAQHADRAVESLSGGEKARLLFALISRKAPALLILDEPTNHLDIQAREALLEALNHYQGAVLLISHDWHLISAAADRLWLAEGGAIQPFNGDLEQYAAQILAQRKAAAGAKASDKSASRNAKAERQAAAKKRAALAPLRRAAEKLEAQLAKLAAKKTALEASLADPNLYDQANEENIQYIKTLQQDIRALEDRMAEVETEWLEVQEKLEQETIS
ncbi:MAG: ABC-F family ATP-binding cassette domain-containing protein [Sphingomonadales bacterium]